MKIKANDLIARTRCSKKGFFEALSLNYSKGKSFHMAIAAREILKDFEAFDMLKAKDSIDAKVSEEFFVSHEEKKAHINNMAGCLQRYFNYSLAHPRTPILKNCTQLVSICGVDVSVTADFVYETEESIEVIKVKTGAPKISYQGRTFETSLKSNVELYLLSEFGNTLGKGKPILASLHYLKSKDDTSKVLVEEFNVKKGKNIFSHSFSSDEELILKNHIQSILDDTPLFSTAKTCSDDECKNCSFKNLCQYQKPQEIAIDIVHDLKKAGELKTTKAQRAAINFGDGIARLNAGAGSGKSTVIALRVVDLLSHRAIPEDILLITFTNKGAQEMREKVAYWSKKMGVSDVKTENIHIMTFNSWGEMVIKKSHSLLGYTQPPSLIEKVQKYDIILEVLSENPLFPGFDYKNPLMNFPSAKGVVVELDEYFNIIKSNMLTSAKAVAKAQILSDEKAEIVFDLYLQFNQKLKEKNLMQYQDQVNLLIYLMDEHPKVLAQFAYAHVMVDEYQDTDKIQFDVISFLVNLSKFKSLMVVGDTAQAIFGFRNVGPENMLGLHNYFKDVKDLFMVDNFRSTPEILQTANALDALNINRIEKNLVSKQASHKKPILARCTDLDTEYQYIAEAIKAKIAEGYKPHEIAFISRTKTELFNLEQYLKEKSIPYVLDIPEPLLNNYNFHALVDFIDFFENTEMTFPLLEYLNIFKGDELKSLYSSEIVELVNFYKSSFETKMLAMLTEESKLAFFYTIMDSIGKKDKEIAAFSIDLQAKEFSTSSALFSYLRKLVKYEDEKSIEKEELKYNAVTLTTGHTSKGKEWEVVFHTLDKYQYSSITKEQEEDRRLLYVAITRAKKELFLTYHTNQDKQKNKGTYPKYADELRFVNPVSVSKSVVDVAV